MRIWNPDASRFQMVKKRLLVCKRSAFKMGSDIRKPYHLKSGQMTSILSKTIWNQTNDRHFVKNHLKSGQKTPDFGSSFQTVVDVKKHLNSDPQKSGIQMFPDFEWSDLRFPVYIDHLKTRCSGELNYRHPMIQNFHLLEFQKVQFLVGQSFLKPNQHILKTDKNKKIQNIHKSNHLLPIEYWIRPVFRSPAVFKICAGLFSEPNDTRYSKIILNRGGATWLNGKSARFQRPGSNLG